MSNLFKGYNVLEPQQGARMIDYNAIVEQKLASLAKQRNASQEAEEGFRELGDIAEEAVKEDPKEVLEKAKNEADHILYYAKEKSDSMIANATAQSEEIFQKAKEDGHQQGYEEGFQKIKEELETEFKQRNEELHRLEEKLREEYDEKMHDLEPDLLNVILTVVEKVFHIQFKDKNEILLYLVDRALANIDGCKSFRVRVSEAQRDFLEVHREEILDRIGHDMSLEIISDLSLEGNQCIIETDTGIFDCSMDVQLKNLIKDLKSLSS